ncbi:MAG TPA: hypothetical protein VFB06_18450 [Streptosporangiaceae bacterium]|nr:hypothetical protein [Streptosporangiaceae bacterium]
MNDHDDPASQHGQGVRSPSLRGVAGALRWRPVNHGQVWLAAVTGWLIVVIVNAAVGRPLLATWPGAAVMLLIGLSESYYLRRTQTAQPAADQ